MKTRSEIDRVNRRLRALEEAVAWLLQARGRAVRTHAYKNPAYAILLTMLQKVGGEEWRGSATELRQSLLRVADSKEAVRACCLT
jgi:O-acetyl-ADP-ribose deacetylase (regulator of RNase III)